MHNSFIMAVHYPVPFNTTLNTKLCGKNKSNYPAIQHQKLPVEMAPKRRAKKQTQEDSSWVFGDRTERLTNSHFLFSYAAKFKLIINNLI